MTSRSLYVGLRAIACHYDHLYLPGLYGGPVRYERILLPWITTTVRPQSTITLCLRLF